MATYTKRNRSANWSYKETVTLLKIWREPEIASRVAAVARDKKKLWNLIATLLHDKGFPVRSGDQIHAKIKGLKSLHRTLHDQKNNLGEVDVTHPFWDDLDYILGGRWANVIVKGESLVGNMLDVDDDEGTF